MFHIVFISPNGSTRIVAETVANRLSQHGASYQILDLAHRSGVPEFVENLESDSTPCILIGSPVYGDMAVPQVMAFIDRLPTNEKTWVVPFVTWGLACSGVALWQMGKALSEKGCRIAGALKVLAVHSMMWQANQPAGAGHPDENDLRQVREFTDKLVSGFSDGALRSLTLDALDYQPEPLAAEFKAQLDKPRVRIPKTVRPDSCNHCEDCVNACPVEALSLDPLPVFKESCIDCFNCIRLCPENAIVPGFPLEKLEEIILDRVKNIAERPPTQVFIP